MNRLLTLLFTLGLLAGPAFGQTADNPSDAAPAEYTFRFVAGNDMFYIPWNGNGEELDRLLACIAQNKTAITQGAIPLRVDGYCSSQSSEAENLAMAKMRSNRVKSELIVRGGLTEACFRTQNHASQGNFVTVRLVIPAGASEAGPATQRCTAEKAEEAEAERPEAECRAEQEPQEPQTEGQRKAEEAKAAETAEPAETVPPVLEESRDETPHTPAAEKFEKPEGCAMGLALRANLLRWATLTPDLGLEWHISSRWSVGVGGSWAAWTWKGVDRRYALWEVAPEVRYHMGKERRGYLGLLFKAGQFNYKLSDTGRQGDLMGGGVTGGYLLPIGKRLSLDFSLGLGYLNADYEKYEVIDGVRVRQGSETRDWWGPVHAGITLKWNLF